MYITYNIAIGDWSKSLMLAVFVHCDSVSLSVFVFFFNNRMVCIYVYLFDGERTSFHLESELYTHVSTLYTSMVCIWIWYYCIYYTYSYVYVCVYVYITFTKRWYFFIFSNMCLWALCAIFSIGLLDKFIDRKVHKRVLA